MYPPIKTFSDLTGIDPTLDIVIVVAFHGDVSGEVTFNGHRCHSGVNHFQIGLFDDIQLTSDIQQFTEGVSAIEITEFSVNGYNVIPKYQHLSSSKNGYHDHLGSWHLNIPGPFYVWYHSVSGQGWIA
jgi:hypothetical protein